MRLDVYLVTYNLTTSRAKAVALIDEGLVLVNGQIAKKPSLLIKEGDCVSLKEHKEYVSRGAYKLLGGIEAFDISFKGKNVLDMGASTGGFTQVALENGAERVYAVDVGRGQLDRTLRQDKRVVCMEERDIRTLKGDELSVDIIVGDLSFISLTKILPHISKEFGRKNMCLLFKPQFECGMSVAKKFKGVIKDERVHISLLKEFVGFLKTINFTLSGLALSPIEGGDGNKEYLVHINGDFKEYNIEKVVGEAFSHKKRTLL